MGDLFWEFIWWMQDYLHGAMGIFTWMFDQIYFELFIGFPWWWPW